MSKYTTEVRFICESKSGLENSSGADNVDEVIAGAWNKIFTSKAPFFDESYRSVLCQKILKHYYLREICCETVGIWKLWMNERLETIMPYYNQLYKSELIKFDPLNDVNLTRKHDRTIDGTEERNGETSDTSNGTRAVTNNGTREITNNGTREITNNGTKNTTNNGTRKITGTNDTKETVTSNTTTNAESNETKKDLYSDTPQGAITGLENENYLTNARKITDNVSSSGSENTDTTRNIDNDYTENDITNNTENDTTNNTENDTTNNTENTTTNNTENMTTNDTKIGTNKITGTSNTTEDYLETLVGKQGSGTYSKMLIEFRDTFLNIDMMIIDEFKDLFFGLW